MGYKLPIRKPTAKKKMAKKRPNPPSAKTLEKRALKKKMPKRKK